MYVCAFLEDCAMQFEHDLGFVALKANIWVRSIVYQDFFSTII